MGRFSLACAGLVGLSLSFVACGSDDSGDGGGSGGSSSGGKGSGASSSGGSSTGGSSDGGSSSGGGGSGGAPSSGGKSGTGGSGGKATTPGKCEAEEPTAVLEDAMLDQLTAIDGGVVFIDRTKGVRWPTQAMGGAVRRIAGSEDDVLFESGQDVLLVSLTAHGDHAYYLDATYTGVTKPAPVRLFRVALSGGTPELVSDKLPELQPLTQFAGVDDDFVYVNLGDEGLRRVSLSNGAVESITTQHVLHNAWLLDDGNLYYTNNAGTPGDTRFSVIPKTATDQTGTVVFSTGCRDPFIANNGHWCVQATPFEQKVNRYDLDGTGMEQLAAFDEGRGGKVAAADANFAYYVTSDLPTLDGHPIWKIPAAGGAPVAVACDRHELDIADTDGVYPTSRGLILSQVAGNSSTIFWLERRATNGPLTLFSAPL